MTIATLVTDGVGPQNNISYVVLRGLGSYTNTTISLGQAKWPWIANLLRLISGGGGSGLSGGRGLSWGTGLSAGKGLSWGKQLENP